MFFYLVLGESPSIFVISWHITNIPTLQGVKSCSCILESACVLVYWICFSQYLCHAARPHTALGAGTEAAGYYLQAHCHLHTELMLSLSAPDMWILSPAIGSKDKIMNCFDECFHPLRNSQGLPPFTLKSQTSLPWLTRLYVFRIPFLIWSLMICPSHTFCIFFELTSRDSGWGILHSQFYFLWILLPHTSVQVSHSDPHFIGRPLLTKLLKSRPLYTLLYLLSKSVYLLSIFSCQNHISPRPEMTVYSNWCQ